jgi:hypothetical protein
MNTGLERQRHPQPSHRPSLHGYSRHYQWWTSKAYSYQDTRQYIQYRTFLVLRPLPYHQQLLCSLFLPSVAQPHNGETLTRRRSTRSVHRYLALAMEQPLISLVPISSSLWPLAYLDHGHIPSALRLPFQVSDPSRLHLSLERSPHRRHQLEH